jgi:hypothetical protein
LQQNPSDSTILAKSTYVICRVLGNELPPRDLPGARMLAFDHIKANESLPPDSRRLWVLNRILDDERRDRLRERLQQSGEKYIELAIDWDAYGRAKSRAEKLTALVGINNARNEAFKVASGLGSFIVILDEDCFFDEDTQQLTFNSLQADQRAYPSRRYYAVPMARVTVNNGHCGPFSPDDLEEPLLVVRSDAQQLFDESLPFGNSDKSELLRRLGLRVRGKRWYALSSEGPCAVLGTILHVNTGPDEIEVDGWARYLSRRESLNRLMRQADELASRHLVGNSAARCLAFSLRARALNALEAISFTWQRAWMQVKLHLRKSL